MSTKTASIIIGPPADTLAEALESVFDGELQMIAEYDSKSYEVLYASDWFLNQHGGLDSVEADADHLFDYFHLDFLERDLLSDMLSLGDVGIFVTYLDHGTIVRALTDDAGIFVVLDTSASVDDARITIENTIMENNGMEE